MPRSREVRPFPLFRVFGGRACRVQRSLVNVCRAARMPGGSQADMQADHEIMASWCFWTFSLPVHIDVYQ